MTSRRIDRSSASEGGSSNVMHSAGSPDWGTPMLLKSFAAAVLRPAALCSGSIDLDYATSAYWQSWWPDGDCPRAFLDGRRGRSVLVPSDRHLAAPRLGAGFFNAPGFGGGEMVQSCWEIFELDHRTEHLGAGAWIGFSLEQFASLQNVGARSPLSADELVTTIVPSRRARYLLHPKQLAAITRKKLRTRKKGSPAWRRETRLLAALRARTDDRPVPGQAPSHASYVTLLWHRDRAVRATQMAAARAFLRGQAADAKSLLHKVEVIGPLELLPSTKARRS